MCEFDSSISLSNLLPSSVYRRSTFDMVRPYLLCTFPSDSVAAEVCGRCVLVKCVSRVVTMGRSASICAEELRVRKTRSKDREKDKGKTWKITFETFGWKLSKSEQVDAMNLFIPSVDNGGKVRMKDPDIEWLIVNEHPVDVEGVPLHPRYDNKGRAIEENKGRDPLMFYFARMVTRGGRGMCEKYKVRGGEERRTGEAKRRSYIAWL